MKLCERCHKNKATIPDRNKVGRPINRICKDCHIKELQGDLTLILNRLDDAVQTS